ncbi:ribosome maturation factor RimM [Sphingomonas montana]|uniref:ribosome maturation factor RimM n=1 Tax=Sphingomonas montana TaxID=1843236 RepID=UPI00096FC43F|nr:ribosome maturation factor RimM [Sphingomonas montana]
MTDRPITLAVIIGAHGIAGEVRLKLFAEDVAGLKAHASFNDGALTLKSLRPGGNGAIARFAEIVDRNGAEAMRGTELSVPRSALPPLAPGEYYHADVIGLPCVDAAGVPIGHVVAIENFGAGDVIEVERPDGKRAMMPFSEPAAVLEPDRVVVDDAFLV